MALNPTLQLPETPISDVPTGTAPGIRDIRAQAAQMLRDAQALPKAGAPGAPPVNPATDAWLKDMTANLPQQAQPTEGIFHGAGQALVGGAGEMAHQVTGL